MGGKPISVEQAVKPEFPASVQLDSGQIAEWAKAVKAIAELATRHLNLPTGGPRMSVDVVATLPNADDLDRLGAILEPREITLEAGKIRVVYSFRCRPHHFRGHDYYGIEVVLDPSSILAGTPVNWMFCGVKLGPARDYDQPVRIPVKRIEFKSWINWDF